MKMRHPIYRICAFKIIAPYIMEIHFDDNSRQTINFAPVLKGELYGPLRDVKMFNQVTIDPKVFTLVWPNGADFDPETLHNWPRYVKELTARAEQWV